MFYYDNRKFRLKLGKFEIVRYVLHSTEYYLSYKQRTSARNPVTLVAAATSRQNNRDESDAVYRHTFVVPSDWVGVVTTEHVRMKEEPLALPRYRYQANYLANPKLYRLTDGLRTRSLVKEQTTFCLAGRKIDWSPKMISILLVSYF